MNIVRQFAILSGVSLAMLGTPALQAQAPGLDLGARVTASVPKGDLGDRNFLDNKVGYGGGVFLAIAVPGGALVPRVDYTVYTNSNNNDARAKMLQAGVDYDFYFRRGENTGPYLGVGAGYGSTKFEQNSPHLNDTPNNIFYAGQAGYMFTHHFGAEVRYTYAEYKPNFDGPRPTYNSPTWNASLILQF
jgi:outer membrane protein W